MPPFVARAASSVSEVAWQAGPLVCLNYVAQAQGPRPRQPTLSLHVGSPSYARLTQLCPLGQPVVSSSQSQSPTGLELEFGVTWAGGRQVRKLELILWGRWLTLLPDKGGES